MGFIVGTEGPVRECRTYDDFKARLNNAIGCVIADLATHRRGLFRRRIDCMVINICDGPGARDTVMPLERRDFLAHTADHWQAAIDREDVQAAFRGAMLVARNSAEKGSFRYVAYRWAGPEQLTFVIAGIEQWEPDSTRFRLPPKPGGLRLLTASEVRQ